MARNRLPDRRYSETKTIHHVLANGAAVKMIVTFGFDGRRVKEVFCADFKAGSDQHALVVDASILVSLLLQQGMTTKEMLETMCRPLSFIGTIVAAAEEADRDD